MPPLYGHSNILLQPLTRGWFCKGGDCNNWNFIFVIPFQHRGLSNKNNFWIRKLVHVNGTWLPWRREAFISWIRLSAILKHMEWPCFDQLLKSFVQLANLERWLLQEPITEYLYVHRAMTHASTAMTPAFLLPGRNLRTLLNLVRWLSQPFQSNRCKKLKQLYASKWKWSEGQAIYRWQRKCMGAIFQMVCQIGPSSFVFSDNKNRNVSKFSWSHRSPKYVAGRSLPAPRPRRTSSAGERESAKRVESTDQLT